MEQQKEFSQESFNKLCFSFKEKKDKLKELNTRLKDLKEEVDAIEFEICDHVKKTDRPYSWKTDSVGSFTIKYTNQIFFPNQDDIESRIKVLKFIKDTMGEQTFLRNLIINYNFVTNLQNEHQDKLKEIHEKEANMFKENGVEHPLKLQDENRQKAEILENEAKIAKDKFEKVKLEEKARFIRLKNPYLIPGIDKCYIKSKVSLRK